MFLAPIKSPHIFSDDRFFLPLSLNPFSKLLKLDIAILRILQIYKSRQILNR